MSIHVFANFVTPFGTSANNRAETEGNITTLQKVLWMGETHSTVSAEAIRFALRRLLADSEATNRSWDEALRANVWADHEFKGWDKSSAQTFIDDDLLGFMIATAAKEESESGSANVRRAVLELTRAVSLSPWAGDVTFNAASPGATPSAQKAGSNPVPYGTELHATRYQYGVAMTPERLREKSRAAVALNALCSLGPVAGNHGRFLFDFSPEAVVFRVTHDPAPRILYCFSTEDNGRTVVAPQLIAKLSTGDIDKNELVVGVSDLKGELAQQLANHGIAVKGVKAACKDACKKFSTNEQAVGAKT